MTRHVAALALALAALAVLPAAAPAKKGRSSCASAAAAGVRPSPVKAHRHGRATTRARLTRACLRSRALVGVSGSGRAGAPAAFGLGQPFGSFVAAPVVAGAPDAPQPTPTPEGPALPTIPASPRTLQVQAYEYGLQLSKPSVLSGGVRIEFNSARAEDPHNLYVARADGTGAVQHFDEQPAGAVTSRTLTLSAGRWTLLCTLPGHEAAGMRTTVTVSDS